MIDRNEVTRVKSKVARARKLRQKLSSEQQTTGNPSDSVNVRTRRKAQMFNEAIARLTPRLEQTSAATGHGLCELHGLCC